MSENISTTLQIHVVNASTGLAVPGATFSWTALAAYTGTDQSPAWFIPTISPSYQTDSNGMISISGTISVGNHPTTTFDRSMAYNWTCTAPNLKSASGTQEFSTASWAATGSELSHTVSYDAFSGVLLQTIQLSP